MNLEQICDTIDLDKRDFSLALVSPREKTLAWLTEFWSLKGLDQYRNYIPEENTVLVIPNLDRFSEVGSLEQFLNEMKPKLLVAELCRFHASLADFAQPPSKEAFDEFFEITLRDSASIRFMSDFENL